MNVKEHAYSLILDVSKAFNMDVADVTAEHIVDFCTNVYQFKVVYYPFNKLRHTIAGTTYITKQEIVIGINSRMTKKRQLFTIMHELGHIFMHADNNLGQQSFSNIANNKGYSAEELQQEKEADLFASFCMLNDHALYKHIQSRPSFLQLAKQFNISDSALSKRLIYRFLECNKLDGLNTAQHLTWQYRYKDDREILKNFRLKVDNM